jgi:succinate dehydrogenase/fumarate reductase cytochrome b subunit
MEQVVKKKPFNKCAFISTSLFVSGLILPLSGYIIHILQFETLSIEKHLCMSVHNVAGILFALFVLLHITFNWSVLLNYAKKAKEKFVSKETLTAVALVIIVVCLFSSHVFHAS